MNPVNLAVCLVQVMVLFHTDKDIVQAAFNAQIQMAYTGSPEGLQLLLGFGPDIGDSGIHVDGAAIRKIPVDQVCYLKKTACVQSKGIAVTEKDVLWIPSQITDPFQLRLYLLHGKLPVFQVSEQSAEFTPVVGTANGNRKHIG